MKSFTFILVLLEDICNRKYMEPTYSTYYRFYNLNAALPSEVVIFTKSLIEQSFGTKIGFGDSIFY